MPTSAQRSINTIENFINQLSGTVKSAEANTEAGSIGGATGHPVKDVDDKTRPAQTGERAAENESDVKEDQGDVSVDATPEAKAAAYVRRFMRGSQKRAEGGPASTPGSAADDQIQIGTNKQPTGDDPANETSSVKGGKKDSDTSHPARTDNDDLAGGKYAYDHNTPLEKIAADIKTLGERICTGIYQVMQGGQLGGQVPYQPAAYGPSKEASGPVYDDSALAYQTGAELAAILNGTLDKRAADAMVHRSLEEIIKTAADDADRYASYLFSLAAEEEELRKIAEGEIPPEMLAGGSAAGGGLPGGDMPPGGEMVGDMAGGAGGAGGGEDDTAAMLAALGGGEDGAGGEGEPDGDEEIDPETLAQLLEELEVGEQDIGDAAAEEAAAGGGAPEEPKMGSARSAGGAKGNDKGKQAVDSSVGFLRELISRSRQR